MNELTQRGITALRSGDRAAARTLLEEAVRIDPDDATAWLWLTGALDADEDRINCLEQVLRIDPDSQPATRGLSQIHARQKERDVAAGGTEQPPASTLEEAVDSPALDEPAAANAIPMPPPAEQQFMTTLREGYSIEETEAGEEETLPAEPALDPSEADALANALHMEPVNAVPAVVETVETPPPTLQSAPLRRKHTAAAEPLHTIFRTRPSLVPALLGFWFFLIGSVAVAVLLRDAPAVLALGLSAGLGVLLLGIVAYTLIRNLTLRYELTNHHLSLRFRGRRVRVPLQEITLAECRQTFFQRMIGTGDVLLNAVVNHELANLRMRNIPECRRKVEQIHAAVTAAGGHSQP